MLHVTGTRHNLYWPLHTAVNSEMLRLAILALGNNRAPVLITTRRIEVWHALKVTKSI